MTTLDLTRTLKDLGGDKGRFLFHGDSGTGKTTLAGSLAELGKVAYIYFSGEEGISSLQEEDWADNIVPVRVIDPTQLREIHLYLAAGQHDFVGVVLDSVSALQHAWLRHFLGLPHDSMRDVDELEAFTDIREWGKLKEATVDGMTQFYGLASMGMIKPMHVVMTAQSKLAEDKNTGLMRIGPDVSSGCRPVVQAMADFVLYTCAVEDPDGELDAPAVLAVRIGRSADVFTKMHSSYKRAAAIADKHNFIGLKNRTTMKKLIKLFGIPE